MAGTALAQIDRANAGSGNMRDQRVGEADIVGVDVEDVGLRIEGRAAPFAAAVIAREHYRLLADAVGNKLAVAYKGMELLQRPLMGLGSSIGEEIFGKFLASE